MECSSCCLSPIVSALAAITSRATVSSRDRSDPAKTVSCELNPLEEKLARELSKKRPKKDTIAAIRSLRDDFRQMEALAAPLEDTLASATQLESLAEESPSNSLSALRSLVSDYKTIYNLAHLAIPKSERIARASSASDASLRILREALPSFRALAALVASALPKFQKICLACSRNSDDDNLSHSGQTFVSIDAMASVGLADSGADPAAEIDRKAREDADYDQDDPNDERDGKDFYSDDAESSVSQTAHDYLAAHAVKSVHALDPNGISNLPPDIEDLLRKCLASFNDLDVFEKMLILSQWSGQSFSDFGSMKWLPREFKRPQSKQLVSQRWAKIVEKFPIADALKRTRPCRNPNSPLSMHFPKDSYEELTFDLFPSQTTEAP